MLVELEGHEDEIFLLRMGSRFEASIAENGRRRCILRRKLADGA